MSDREQFQLLFPEENFDKMHNYIESFHKMITFYKCAMMQIETKLKILNEEFSHEIDRNPINNIKCRLKSFPSIRAKAERNGCPMTPDSIEENLNDIAGVRVICSFKDDVYNIANALTRQNDITLVSKKDYIENPKPNGYRSLHMIVMLPVFFANEKQYVKVEVQLRTIAMDFWASLEHQLKYKKNACFTDEMSDELYKCAQISYSLDEKMNRLKNAVFE